MVKTEYVVNTKNINQKTPLDLIQEYDLKNCALMLTRWPMQINYTTQNISVSLYLLCLEGAKKRIPLGKILGFKGIIYHISSFIKIPRTSFWIKKDIVTIQRIVRGYNIRKKV